MGENKYIEELDVFTKKYIKEIKEETPSINFTNNLMNILQKENTFIYKATPLISKKMWVALFSLLLISVLYVSRGSSLGWLKMPKVNFNFLSKIQMPSIFETITISNTMLYACFFFTIMIFVQIFYLKNHLTKKFES